jgi:hypothetical protein
MLISGAAALLSMPEPAQRASSSKINSIHALREDMRAIGLDMNRAFEREMKHVEKKTI